MTEKIHLYAIVSVDKDIKSFEEAITVKEVLPTQEDAEFEVERLNRMNSNKGIFYFWQLTRFYPEGRKLRKV